MINRPKLRISSHSRLRSLCLLRPNCPLSHILLRQNGVPTWFRQGGQLRKPDAALYEIGSARFSDLVIYI